MRRSFGLSKQRTISGNRALERVVRTVAELLERRLQLTTVSSIGFDLDSPDAAIVVAFDAPITASSLTVSDLIVRRVGSDGRFATTQFTMSLNSANTTATFTRSGQYPDGDYTVDIVAEDVYDSLGDALTADASSTFFFMGGDATGPLGTRDRHSDSYDSDLATFNAGLHPATFSQGDYDGDSTVTTDDLDLVTETVMPNPLDGVTSLTGTVGSGGVQLEWTHGSSTSTGFRVQRSSDRGRNYTTIASTTGASTVSYFDGSAALAGIGTYLYRVRSIEPADAFNHVPPVSRYAVAELRYGTLSTSVVPIQAPGNLAISSLSKNSIALVWTDLSDGETGYEIWRSIDAGASFAVVKTLLQANATGWVDTGLKASKQYRYKVRTLGAVPSASSNVAIGTTLGGAPAVIAGDLDTASPQRLVAEFDQPIFRNGSSLDEDQVNVYSLTAGHEYVGGPGGDFYIDGISGDRLQIRFTGTLRTGLPLGVQGVLPDGNYEITVAGDAVKNAAGLTIGDSGNPDREAVGETFFYAGDFNHDRKVDFADLLVLTQNLGLHNRTYAQGDSNFDGAVDFQDLLRLAQQYQSSYPAALTGVSSLQASTGPLAAQDPFHSATSSDAAYVEWTAPAAAEGSYDGYKLWRSIDGVHFGQPIATLPISQFNYIDRGLVEGERYTYRVRPYKISGEFGTVTNRASVVTTLHGPSNVTTESLTEDSFQVFWSDNSSNESGFSLKVVDSQGQVVTTQPTAANATSATVTGLAEGKTYTVYVSAVTNAAAGYASVGIPASTRIARPTNVIASVINGSSSNVSWTDNSTRESAYTIRWLASGDYTDAQGRQFQAGDVLGSVSAPPGASPTGARSITITGLPADAPVYFDVTGEAGTGGTSSSTAASSTAGDVGPATGRPVSGVTAAPILTGDQSTANADEYHRTSNRIIVKWSDNQPKVDHYNVWMESPKKALLGIVDSTHSSKGDYRFTASALDPMQEYRFSVQPEVTDALPVNRVFSATVETGLQYSGEAVAMWSSQVGSHKATINWNPIENGDAYFILNYYIAGTSETDDHKQIFGENAHEASITGLHDSTTYVFTLKIVYHNDRYIENAVRVSTPEDPDSTHDVLPHDAAWYANAANRDTLLDSENYTWETNYGVGWYVGYGTVDEIQTSPPSWQGSERGFGFDHAYSMTASNLRPTAVRRLRFHTDYMNEIVYVSAKQSSSASSDAVKGYQHAYTQESRYVFDDTLSSSGAEISVHAVTPTPVDGVSSNDQANTITIEARAYRAVQGEPMSDVWIGTAGSIATAQGYSTATTHVAPGQTIRLTAWARFYTSWSYGNVPMQEQQWNSRIAVKAYTARTYRLDKFDDLEGEDDVSTDGVDHDGDGLADRSPVPTGLQVLRSTATTNTIQLRDNAKNEEGLEVERTRDGRHWSRIWWGGAVVDTIARNIEFVDGGLEPGVEYEYRARAFKWTKTDEKLNPDGGDGDANKLDALQYTPWSASTEQSKGTTDAKIGVWSETPKAKEGQTTASQFGLYTLGEFDLSKLPAQGYQTHLQVPVGATATYLVDYTIAQGTGLPTSGPVNNPIDFNLLVSEQLQMLNVNIAASDSEIEDEEYIILGTRWPSSTDPNYEPASPDAKILLSDGLGVDLQIDVDNSGSINAHDDAVKDDASVVGAYTDINNVDRNDNGIPDYADGYTAGSNVAWGTTTPGTTFEPMILNVHNVSDWATATIQFVYAASDPAAVQEVANPGHALYPSERAFDYVLPAGMFRLWLKDGSNLRNGTSVVNGGDFIPANTAIPLSKLLSGGSTQVTLYLEAVRHNGAAGLTAAPNYFDKQPIKAIVGSGGDTADSSAPAVPVYTDKGWQALTYNLSRFNPKTFQPAAGWTSINRSNMIDIYEYYDQLYTAGYQLSVSTNTVNKMQWAGLAKVAGLEVVAGLDMDAVSLMTATFNSIDGVAHALLGGFTLPSTSAQIYAQASVTVPLLHNQIMLMAREIFDDIGWQHSAYFIGGISEIDRLDSAGLIPPSIVDVPAAWHLIDSGTASGVWNGTTVITNQEQIGTLARGYGVIATMPLMTYSGVTFTGDMAVTGMSELFRPLDSAMTFIEFNQAFGSSVGFLTTGTLRWQWIVHVLGAWQAKTESQRFAIAGTPFP